ncbi:MAG: nuclear transport factor 2 family protein [Bauldia sp.]|nr:nuclear transport factor 2 family protein [Bauldia sp.]MCW5716643.1 nuclear transport factor 2 family protein [Bauldia sp.]
MTGRQDVGDAADRFYAALNRLFAGDAQPMKDAWSHADDITYMGPSGLYLVGWQQIEQEWDAQAAALLGGRVTPQNLHVVVGADLAVITCVEAGENVVDGRTETVRIRSSTVFRKEVGGWKVIGHQTDLLGFLSPS